MKEKKSFKLFILLFVISGMAYWGYLNFLVDSHVNEVEEIKKVDMSVNKEKSLERKLASSPRNLKQDYKLDEDIRVTFQARKKEKFEQKKLLEKMKVSVPPFPHKDGYHLVEDYVAIEANKDTIEQYPFAFEKLGHLLIPKTEAASDENFALLYNDNSKTLAIVTGVVKVTFKDRIYYDLGFFDNYESATEYERINKVFFKFSNFQQAQAALDFAKNSDTVKRADLELIEYERGAR